MRFSRIFLAPTALSLAVAPVVLVHKAQAQDLAAATQYLVASVVGREGTLSAGTAAGVRVGSIYEIVRNGQVGARARVTRVFSTRSDLRFTDVQDGFQITVGDIARLVADQPETPGETPAAEPLTPAPVAVETPVAATPVNAAPVNAEPAAPAARPTLGYSTLVTVGATNGEVVTINAGSAIGLETGKNLPILRNGSVIAIVSLQSVSPNSSEAKIVWSDAMAGPVQPGDGVQLAGAVAGSAGSNSGPLPAMPPADPGPGFVPAAPVRFESGASNFTVPKNDRTYDLLASLAADRLITSQPAYIFHDDGTRRHRTEEDLTFTRNEIVGFVKEALTSPRFEGAKTRSRFALSSLVSTYRSDLVKEGFDPTQLEELAPRKGFEIGFSGQSRASLVGGDDDNVLLPFSERNGSLRTRSGFDSRNNIFGRIGDRLSFYATIDGGTDRSRGTDDRNYDVRRAIVSYNAGNLLRGLTIEAGRQEYWWGPGHFGTLLLSDNAGPLNSVRTVFKRGSYSLESLYSPLNGNRSLYGHNLQVKLGQNTRVGFAETVLAPQRSLDGVLLASTFSPIPLALAQRKARENNAADNSNVLATAYFETGLARGFNGYGEILVDDLGYTDSNKVRNRIGTLLGAHIFKPGDPGKLGLYTEYANLEGRTYLRFSDPGAQLPGYDYFYRGNSLGYSVSPRPIPSPANPADTPGLGGASSFRTDFYWRIKPRLRVGAGLELADLDSELDIISRQQIYRFRAAYDVARNYTLVARAQRVSTSNPGFVSGAPLRQKMFQLEVVRAF